MPTSAIPHAGAALNRLVHAPGAPAGLHAELALAQPMASCLVALANTKQCDQDCYTLTFELPS